MKTKRGRAGKNGGKETSKKGKRKEGDCKKRGGTFGGWTYIHYIYSFAIVCEERNPLEPNEK